MTLRTEEQSHAQQMRSTVVYIINPSDEAWVADRPHGAYRIAARAEGERYSATEVRSVGTALDMGDRRKFELTIFADEIAADLIREQMLDEFGLFVSETKKPTEAALAAAERKLQATYLRLVDAGDTEWMRFRRVEAIPEIAKRAAKRTGQKREWLSEVVENKQCPACGERVNPQAAVCKSCRCVLDEKRFAQMKFADEEPVPTRSRR